MKSITKPTTKSVVEKAKKVHGDKYDYSKTTYSNARTKIEIICKIHGSFFQRPNHHIISKSGCPKCSLISIKDWGGGNKNDFTSKAKDIHSDSWDYSKVDYKHSKEKVEIMCPKHGSFHQSPMIHLQGHGCPKCSNDGSSSKCEGELLSYVEDNFDFEILTNTRSIIPPYELDIFIPSLKLAIEFNGNYWHSYPQKDKNYHQIKSELCEGQEIRLIHVYEYQWYNHTTNQKIKSLLNSFKPLSKLFARKCLIRNVDVCEEKEFINKNHLQNYIPSSFNFGLYNENILVQIMSFVSRGNDIYEIQRLCTKSGLSIIGGAEKLFHHAKKELISKGCKTLISYSDRGVFTGNVYDRLGMERLKPTEPNYIWIKGGEILSRQQCQKHKLIKMGFDENLSENEIMLGRGFRKIYNSGNHKFVLNLSQYQSSALSPSDFSNNSSISSLS